ncbi:MAG: alpha/beta hydrolase [Eubacterium sp.]|nr:alpha/beta hydrolase [Eubacterium sp.]
MKKSTVFALAGLGAAAGIGAFAIHSYLDVMYKETIPKGLAKRVMEMTDNGEYEPLHKMCEESMKWVDSQDIETITMNSDRGEELKGFLLMADKPSKVFTVFAHGYRANHRGDSANFFKYYHDKGFNYLAVDHTASGESGGDWVGFDYYESQDMLKWLNYLIDRFGEDISITLHGVSMGGATVCRMADKVPPQVKLIVADCPYTSAIDEFTSVAAGAGIKKTAPYILKGMNYLNKRLAGYDLADTDVRQSVINSRVPMLFVHGAADDFVPTYMGEELYNLCGNEKDILIVDNAVHASSIVVDTEGYQKKLDEFIDKYIK